MSVAMQSSFGSAELAGRLKRDSVLSKIDALIDWTAIRASLSGLYKRDHSRAGGQEPYDSLLMFKATLLGQWHSLSDPKLEEALTVRLDFMHFCGLELSDCVPDESTLGRFRHRLIQANRLETLLGEFNAQLSAHGLMVNGAAGAVIDATIIQSAARPHKTITLLTDEQGQVRVQEDDTTPGVLEEKLSHDTDATWLKKGKKSHYGYRSYVAVDAQDGYIQAVHTAPANESETQHLLTTVEKTQTHFQIDRLYTDKGFSTEANRQALRQQGIKAALQYRAYRQKPLTKRQTQANKLISKRRYIVEQAFGTAKRLLGVGRASYVGTVKVNAQMLLKAMCLNLLKAANKIQLASPAAGKLRLETAK